MRDGMIKFDDCFPIRASAWLRLLTLAENFGWEPIGQAMKERDPEYVNEENAEQGFVNNWDSYNVGNIQLLKKEDLLNIAEALTKAIAVIPDKKVSPNNISCPMIDGSDPQKLEILSLGDSISYFSGSDNKNFLIAFILFCQTLELDNYALVKISKIIR